MNKKLGDIIRITGDGGEIECKIVGQKGQFYELIPIKCICDEDQGCGYTFKDEYGACPYCDNSNPFIEEIN